MNLELIASPKILFAIAVSAVALAAVGTTAMLRPEKKLQEKLAVSPPAPATTVRVIPIYRDLPAPKSDNLLGHKIDDRIAPSSPQPSPIVVEKPRTAEVVSESTTSEDTGVVTHHSRHRISNDRPRRTSNDLCSRTGGWKVEINHGKSWRCAYRR